MKEQIKYEDLSQQLKLEIEQFHKNEVKKGKKIKIEDAMFKWFDKHFDSWVLKNYGNSHANKRKHFRIYIEIPIRVTETLVESTAEEAIAMDMFGTVENISRGGFFFKSGKEIEASSIIRVKIDLKKVDKKLKDIEALAMVLRCDKLENNKFGIGLMFSSIYDENRENLDTFIFRNVVDHINILKK